MLDKNINIRCSSNDLANLKRLQERAQRFSNNSYVSSSDVIRFLINSAIFDKDFDVNCGNWASIN